MSVTFAPPFLRCIESTFCAMMPAVVAFETEKLYEKAESSLAIQPSCLKRPIIVVHVDAFAFQPCTNRMIGFGCRGGALLASGSPGSVMELHAPSTMRAVSDTHLTLPTSDLV